tara:strand:+ start:4434 stop:4670 length:237 start_codon:yes stop_codon:yes gene_type:complete
MSNLATKSHRRHGAVLVFKRGVTPHQAAAALKKIADVLDIPERSFTFTRDGNISTRFHFTDLVNDFDERDGGPVWYVP